EPEDWPTSRGTRRFAEERERLQGLCDQGPGVQCSSRLQVEGILTFLFHERIMFCEFDLVVAKLPFEGVRGLIVADVDHALALNVQRQVFLRDRLPRGDDNG